jgi:hypothetical protein
MNRITNHFDPEPRSDLDRVIEPLADYICATERPGAALKSALSILLQAVEETNRVAKLHFRAVANGGLS